MNKVHCLLNEILSKLFIFLTGQFDSGAITIIFDGIAFLFQCGKVFLCLFNLSSDCGSELIVHVGNLGSVLKGVFLTHIVKHTRIPVNASETVITASLDDINESFPAVINAEVKQSDVESSAAKVIHHDFAVFFEFTNAVIQRRSSRLMNNIQDVQASDDTGLPCGGFFFISKVCRTGNNNILYIVPLCICICLHSLKNQGGNGDGIIFYAVKLICGCIGFANVSLNEFNNSFRLDILLVLCNFSHNRICPVLEIDSRSEKIATFILICDNLRHSIVIERRDDGIGGSQVDSVNFCHFAFPPYSETGISPVSMS